jgi:hypothetical protein
VYVYCWDCDENKDNLGRSSVYSGVQEEKAKKRGGFEGIGRDLMEREK